MAYVRRRRRLGPAFRLAVVLLKPLLTITTRRHWSGLENLEVDPGGIVVAANHMTWIDPLIISHALWDGDRPPRFLAKVALFHVTFIGWVLRDAGQIPVYRESREAAHAVQDAVTAVQQGECVVVYPEGTLTRDPELWPMAAKTGAARIALLSGRPLVPLAHWGAQRLMRPYRKEFKPFPRKDVHVIVGPPVDLDDLRAAPLTNESYHIATDRLMDAITALQARLRDETPPLERFVWNRRGTPASDVSEDPEMNSEDSV
jgi:1-acyl-sn-glycerol-3-phosphate acyltransferase